MATVNPYEAPQSVELASAKLKPNSKQNSFEILAYGTSRFSASIYFACILVIFGFLIVALQPRMLALIGCIIAIVYIILQFSGLVYLRRLGADHPCYGSVRQATIGLLTVICLILLLGLCHSNHEVLNRSELKDCTPFVIYVFLALHFYAMLSFQQQAGHLFCDKQLQDTVSATRHLAFLAVLGFICIIVSTEGRYYWNECVKPLAIIWSIFSALLALNCYASCFSRIQKLARETITSVQQFNIS